MRTRLSIAAAVFATTAALGTAACSSPDGDARPAGTPQTVATTATADAATQHNDADTEFAQMMIVHHQGAVEMARLAVSNAATEDVRALGERIAAAQGPEIDLMSGWLDAWGEDQPEEAEMSGMGHEGMDMDGLDQESAMAELSSLTGTAFDQRFLELMIEHHQGAIEMSETERGDGENPDATQLAGRIIDAQMAEITEMTNLRNTPSTPGAGTT